MLISCKKNEIMGSSPNEIIIEYEFYCIQHNRPPSRLRFSWLTDTGNMQFPHFSLVLLKLFWLEWMKFPTMTKYLPSVYVVKDHLFESFKCHIRVQSYAIPIDIPSTNIQLFRAKYYRYLKNERCQIMHKQICMMHY